MQTTLTLSQTLNVSPFEIFQQDSDEVIMLINYYVVLSKEKPQKKAELKPKAQKYGSKNERIRVDDKTATGGWY